MSLQDWLREGHLRPQTTNRQEIRQLLAVFERDISDARIEGLSTDRKFAIAYNAALMMARAGLAACGYQTSGKANHYWAIRSLEFSIQVGENTIRKLDAFRRKRNLTNYEISGAVSEIEAEEMLALAIDLRDQLEAWLKREYPSLLSHPDSH